MLRWRRSPALAAARTLYGAWLARNSQSRSTSESVVAARPSSWRAASRAFGSAAVSLATREAEDNTSLRRGSDARNSGWDWRYAWGEVLRRSSALSKCASAEKRPGAAVAASADNTARRARLKRFSSLEAAAVATSGSSHAAAPGVFGSRL